MTDTLANPDTAPANSGGATATLEAPAGSTATADPSGGQPHPDQAAFDTAMKNAGLGKPDATPTPDKAQAEIPAKPQTPDPAKNEGQQPEPFSAALTDKAKRFMGELGLTEDKVFDAAVAAYERYTGFTEKQLDKMLADDEESFVEGGLKLAKIQRDNASFTAEHHRVLEELKALKQGAGQSQPQTPAAPQPLSATVKQVIDKAMEGLPDDEYVEGKNVRDLMGIGLTATAEQLAALHQAQAQQMQKAYDEKLGEQAKQLDDMHVYLHDLQLSQARTRLTAKHQTLADDKVFANVRKHYDALAGSGKYTIDEALERAASAELGEASTNQIRDRLLKNHATRKAVQPRLPSAMQSRQNVPMSPEDKDRLQFARSMEKGYGKDWSG